MYLLLRKTILPFFFFVGTTGARKTKEYPMKNKKKKYQNIENSQFISMNLASMKSCLSMSVFDIHYKASVESLIKFMFRRLIIESDKVMSLRRRIESAIIRTNNIVGKDIEDEFLKRVSASRVEEQASFEYYYHLGQVELLTEMLMKFQTKNKNLYIDPNSEDEEFNFKRDENHFWKKYQEWL